MIRSRTALPLLLLLAATPLLPQASLTGSLEGIVADGSGAAVPGATVTLRHRQSSRTRTLVTSESGTFQAPSLPAGDYSLHVEKPGFTPVDLDAIPVALGQLVSQRIVLRPASLTESIDVQEEYESLQTAATTAAIGLGGDRIEEAPAQGRNYLNFVLTAPGVSPSAGANTGRSIAGTRNPANDSGFVFNGIRGRNNSISIDGVDNRDETTGGNRVTVSLEMVQEFRVSSTSMSAEFGGAAGGLVNVVTHSGQNLWHGDFTYFFQNELFNARNAEAALRRRPRFRKHQPGVSTGGPLLRDKTYFFTALEQTWESGEEWSDAPAFAPSALSAALRSPRFARAGIPPLAPGVFAAGERDTEYSLKATHLLTASNTLTGRYAFSRGRVRNDVQSGDNFLDVSARGSSRLVDHSFVGGWNWTISPTRLNDLRFQFGQRTADLTPNTTSGAGLEIPGVITFGRAYRLDQSRTERHWELIENYSASLGSHLLSLGASAHRVAFAGSLANRFHGLYVFPSVDAFLAGQPDLFLQSFGEPRTRYSTLPLGLWINDRWTLRPGLTLEGGLRYDYQFLPSPFPNPGKNIAPRLGLAWHPSSTSAWVFRAGAGLFYDRYPLAFLNDAIQKGGPNGFDQILSGNAAADLFAATQGGELLAPLPGVAPSFYRPANSWKSTYSRKLTAGVERRLDSNTTLTLELSNVRGLHLPRTRNGNLGYPPQFALEQSASSSYRGAAFTLHRRIAKELAYLVTYNLSRTRDDASDFDEQPQNPANTRADWARSRQDQRHRLAVSGLFELPAEEITRAPEWLRDALDHITLAPILTWGSSRPLNPLLPYDAYRTGAYPLTARPAGFARNSQNMPRIVSLDLRLMKTIPLWENRARLQFGAEALNLLNHTNRLRVSPFYTPTFGRLIEAQIPRQVQLMLQLEY